jgi:hypothetical protein
MSLTDLENGVRRTLTGQEETDKLSEWAASKVINDAEEAAKTAMEIQVQSEKTALLTRAQIATAIDNAFPDTAQANIIKKLANVVYTFRKNSVT